MPGRSCANKNGANCSGCMFHVSKDLRLPIPSHVVSGLVLTPLGKDSARGKKVTYDIFHPGKIHDENSHNR